MTNKCTWSPDFDFTEVCGVHDVSYKKIWLLRKEADLALKAGLEAKGHNLIAQIYYSMTRLFGKFFI